MVTKPTILGIPCVSEDYTSLGGEVEYYLKGKYGIIYPYDDKGNYFILITGIDIANKYIEDYYFEGDEIGIIVNEEEAKKWIKRLKIK